MSGWVRAAKLWNRWVVSAASTGARSSALSSPGIGGTASASRSRAAASGWPEQWMASAGADSDRRRRAGAAAGCRGAGAGEPAGRDGESMATQ